MLPAFPARSVLIFAVYFVSWFLCIVGIGSFVLAYWVALLVHAHICLRIVFATSAVYLFDYVRGLWCMVYIIVGLCGVVFCCAYHIIRLCLVCCFWSGRSLSGVAFFVMHGVFFFFLLRLDANARGVSRPPTGMFRDGSPTAWLCFLVSARLGFRFALLCFRLVLLCRAIMT